MNEGLLTFCDHGWEYDAYDTDDGGLEVLYRTCTKCKHCESMYISSNSGITNDTYHRIWEDCE